MGALTVQQSVLAGVAAADAACGAGGDYFTPGNNSVVFLAVKNASAGVLKVKIDDPTTSAPASHGMAGSWDPDAVISVTNGTTRIIKIDTPARFINASDSNRINLTYPDGVASLTISVFV